MYMLALFFSTDVDSFNICQPSFAKVAMWMIMADFLNKNMFALFYYYFFFFRFCSLVVLTSFTKIPRA